MLHQLRGGVFGADIEGNTASTETGGQGIEIGLGLGHVEQDDFTAVAGQGFGNRRANPTGGAGDQGLAPGQRSAPVVDSAVAGAQVQDLAADVGAFRRQKEAQGAFELVLGLVVDVQQLQGTAVAQLLGQRTAEAFQGPLCTGGERIAQPLGRTAENHHMGARFEVPQQ